MTTRTYAHELNREIRSISGWYMLEKEERITHRGRDYVYAVGQGAVETSCCGIGGCRYALVPGAVLRWKSKTDDRGVSLSEVEPVSDPQVQEELRRIIFEKEDVSQVNFL
jgi:hypothetical protein